jgi:hypothetical protein
METDPLAVIQLCTGIFNHRSYVMGKLLLLLLLNRLPPDITGGQGLNGFQKLLFFTILQKIL